MPPLVEQLVAFLARGRATIFHFTDERNLPSIRQHGLVPTAKLDALGIQAVTGGDADSLGIDRHRGFDQYVRTSFCRQHPMSYVAQQRGSIETLRILRVDPSVLLRDGVRMSDRVATANEAIIGSPQEMIPLMDLESTFQRTDWRVPEIRARREAAEKWEALIPGVISPHLIQGL